MKLIAGLGNPGTKYEKTRHNVGFDTLQEVARRCGAESPRTRFNGLCSECMSGGEKLLLLAPQTFMNRSGTSVRQAVDFYKLALSDVLVVCDEFQLPLGQIRLRGNGSDGGQNGLADVLAKLGSRDVCRLRIGVGPLPPEWNPADFVLGKFTAAQREEADAAVARAAEAALVWASQGIGPAMNQFNQRRPDSG